jgi:hypothetical protein
VATVFEPASEQTKGMDELHEQTVNLLSFQPLPKKVFDTQVAFNMVARYGEQAVPALATIERRVLKHYNHCRERRAPLSPDCRRLSFMDTLLPSIEMEKPVEIDAIQGPDRRACDRHRFSGGVPQQRERGRARRCWSRSARRQSRQRGVAMGVRRQPRIAAAVVRNMAATAPKEKSMKAELVGGPRPRPRKASEIRTQLSSPNPGRWPSSC